MIHRHLYIWLMMLAGTTVQAQIDCGTVGRPSPLSGEIHLRERMDPVFQVVVHIVYANDDENLPDDQIRSQIDILNRDFQGRSPGQYRIQREFRDRVKAPGWTFCLAETDPNGNPTSGIVRVRTNVAAIAHPGSLERGFRKIKFTGLGGSDTWDPERYINVWVGSTGEDVVIGDATFPGTAKEGEDGIMVDYRVFGGLGTALSNIPFHLGKTLTHEMGHFFNLAHLSGNGDCTVDDGIDDTPVQGREYFDCPPGPVESCGSTDMVQNFLSLAGDPCLLFFTNGQVTAMEGALMEYRSGLIAQSVACSRPSTGTGPDLEKVKVIGHPGSAQILIHLQDYPADRIELDLFDITGRSIWKTTLEKQVFFSMNSEDLPSGLYLLRLGTNGVSRTWKLFL